MKEPAILCPIKETLTYLSVCDTKCTHNRAKCEELKAKIIEETRHCIDCANQDSEFCDPCLDNTPRERFFWAPKIEKEGVMLSSFLTVSDRQHPLYKMYKKEVGKMASVPLIKDQMKLF